MAKLNRVPQKIFGETGGTGEFGAFGSDAVGTPTTTKNLETIQSLAPYAQGLFAATNNANEPPRIQDINALYLLFSSQLAYYFQNGLPEWDSATSYYAVVSYCQKGGVVYRSVTNDNVNHDPATDDGTYWEAGEESLRSLKFDLDRLGFTGYALYTDKYLADKLRIARRMSVGDTIISSVSHTPTAFADAQSTAHPTYPEYFPAIPRHDADHDISTDQVPQWVIDELNAEKLAFGAVSDFTATLASGVLTFASTTENTNLLAWVTEQALVARWYGSSEAANYGSLGGLFTGTAQLSVTIAGVNYAVTGCSIGSRTITLATAPADGSVTVAVYPCRIAGSTTSSRLRRISGEALVAAGDVTGEVTVGGRRMGKILGFSVYIPIENQSSGTNHYSNTAVAGSSLGENSMGNTIAYPAGTSNTLVTGKSNDPRTAGMAVYTHLGVVLATNWT
jgi:hypothetical protein